VGVEADAAKVIATRRLTSQDDLSQATTLLKRFFREEGFDTPDEVIASNTIKMASLDVCGLLIAEAGGATIGVATVSMDFGIEYGWSAEMGDLYVLPEWRGKGVSIALVKAIEDFLKSKGAAGYQVTVTPYASEHHDLKQFYMRLGFDDEGRLLFYKSLR
jgi:GNAT superfamily N-acetyltransferase